MSPLVTMPRREMLERIAPDLVRPLATVKREHIERAMILCKGNATEAAKRLGISYRYLLALLKRWRMEDADA